MYITYETIASNDPRNDSRIQYAGTFWHYTIARIDDSIADQVRYDWLKGVVLDENTAMAHKLATAIDGEITVVNSKFNSYADIAYPTSGGDLNYKKEIYFLTEQDDTRATRYMQAVLENYTDNHLVEDGILNPPGTKQKLIEEISAANTLNEIQMVMKSYFDVDVCLYTQGRPKINKFEVRW